MKLGEWLGRGEAVLEGDTLHNPRGQDWKVVKVWNGGTTGSHVEMTSVQTGRARSAWLDHLSHYGITRRGRRLT